MKYSRVYIYSINAGQSSASIVNETPYSTVPHAAKILGVSGSTVYKAIDKDIILRGCYIKSNSRQRMYFVKPVKGATVRYAIYDATGSRIHYPNVDGEVIVDGNICTAGISYILGNTLEEIRALYKNVKTPSLRMLQKLTSDKLKARPYYDSYLYKGLWIKPVASFNVPQVCRTKSKEHKVCAVHMSVEGIPGATNDVFKDSRIAKRVHVSTIIHTKQNSASVCIYCRAKLFQLTPLANSIYATNEYLKESARTYDEYTHMTKEQIKEQLTRDMLNLYILNLGVGPYKPVAIKGKLVQNGAVATGGFYYKSAAHYVLSQGPCPTIVEEYLVRYNKYIISKYSGHYVDGASEYQYVDTDTLTSTLRMLKRVLIS